MKVPFRTPLAAFALSSALAGVAVPAFADSYYQGIDPHNPPGTQNAGSVMVPVPASPYYVDPAPTGSVYVDPAPTGTVYVDPTPTGSIDVDPAPMGSRANNVPGKAREHYTNEYQGPGDGDYYQGISPPAPRP
ncbi:hypothetical protein CN167_08440 [Sinorhizobium medicae]|uniref:hypothetical protein n=1 Tax=Sinorhizobium medicae TaxID=110321 RepID=UPI000FDC98DA|nr:hypothetical protein [Sinorhizobium medicae]RVJ78970.1 hypothetical protein CN167_08440 [Sinorhizobium medicae]